MNVEMVILQASSELAKNPDAPQHSWWATSLLAGIPALLGVLIGWMLGEVSNRSKDARDKRRELEREARQQRRETKILALALAAELEGLFSRYISTIAETLRNTEHPQDFRAGYVPPRFNYFVVFDANASRTGLLKSEDARDLVSFYILAKGHFEDLVTWVSVLGQSIPDAGRLIMFTVMKKDNEELMRLFPSLIRRLNDYPD
jgi:hypothetical protein